ncbi:MOB kinase activator 2-like [Oscarella lobularis]|uniref:MOB kinase activator 2-like n=1 Tax=Oscarella lobularis TaxID=121494 RepID=UPI003313B5F3
MVDWFIGKGKRKSTGASASATATSDDKKLFLDPQYIDSHIVDGDLRQMVLLPPGTDKNEWIASQTLAYFNHFNLIYGAISEMCTPVSCPLMTAGSTVYTWHDDKHKKVKLSAPQYVDLIMTTCQKQLQDESLFPTKFGQDFPSHFVTSIRKIYRWLFHVGSHVYQHHYQDIIDLHLCKHLNTLFTHFIFFSNEFELLDSKDLSPLADLVENILGRH